MTKRTQGQSVRGLATLLVATAAGLTLFAFGCGDNSGNPTGYQPEGQTGAILLTDVQPFDAETTQVYVQMFVASPPPADGFRFYVNPNDEGYRPASESAIPATTTFDSGWSLFQSALDGYDPTTTNLTLMARGSRNGVESVAAPVTTQSAMLVDDALSLARRVFVQQTSPRDSAGIPELAFSWLPVPGATSYLLQASNASTGELGLLVYLDEPTTSVAELEVSVLPFVPYRWLVVAYDGGRRAIGVSPARLFGLVPPESGGSVSQRVKVTVGPAEL